MIKINDIKRDVARMGKDEAFNRAASITVMSAAFRAAYIMFYGEERKHDKEIRKRIKESVFAYATEKQNRGRKTW